MQGASARAAPGASSRATRNHQNPRAHARSCARRGTPVRARARGRAFSPAADPTSVPDTRHAYSCRPRSPEAAAASRERAWPDAPRTGLLASFLGREGGASKGRSGWSCAERVGVPGQPLQARRQPCIAGRGLHTA